MIGLPITSQSLPFLNAAFGVRTLFWSPLTELNLIPEIINFTNEMGLTDYFIDSLEGMKEGET